MRSNYLTLLLSVCGASVALAAAVNWVVDPMHYYHPPWFDTGFSDQQRFQNPGLARTADYDTVLIGTSHTEIFTTSDMDHYLGGRTINLSMAGSLVAEQRMLLDVVLGAGKVKRVLWEINYPSFSLGDDISQPESFPFYLYQTGIETPFRYLMSWATLQESLLALTGQRTGELDQLHRWDLEFEFGEERVLDNWDYMTARWNDELRRVWALYEVSETELAALVENEVIELAHRYPDIQFDLLFLPSSMLDYSKDFGVSASQFEKKMLLRRQLARQSAGIGNVRLWDFQQVEWMSRDFSHYKDLEHFDQQVAQAVLAGMSEGTFRVSPARLADNTSQLEQSVLAFTARFCRQNTNRCQPVLLENLESSRQTAGADF